MRNKQTYIIGEIGQNHNGSMDLAHKIIDAAAMPVHEDLFDIDLPRLDAVKLTKRDLNQELAGSLMKRPYNSPHSFGETYGAHRAFLELNDQQHYELYQYAKAKGLEFVETLCAIGCLSLLRYFKPDYLKVASRDLTNHPLLDALAETGIPMILSTGMADKSELDEALECITRYHSKLSILHCVSEYPTHPENVNLNTLLFLQKNYPDFTIGYSDHTIGISVPVAAVAMGSEIIEKHITLDRELKGTDQRGSLGPEGIQRMVRDIRLLEMSKGVHDIFQSPDTGSSKKKLARSIALKRPIKEGEYISEADIWLLSPGDGFKWVDKDQVIGKKLIGNVAVNEIIYPEMLSE